VVLPASASMSASGSSVARPSASRNATSGAGNNRTANATSAEGAAVRQVVDAGVGAVLLLGASLVVGAIGGVGLFSW